MEVDDTKKRTQFQLEMEQAIALANREVMKSAELPPVKQDTVLPLAIAVARLRSPGTIMAHPIRSPAPPAITMALSSSRP